MGSKVGFVAPEVTTGLGSMEAEGRWWGNSGRAGNSNSAKLLCMSGLD